MIDSKRTLTLMLAIAVVAAGIAARAAAQPPPPPAPVRVGGQIPQPTKIVDVKPVYPPIAQSARVQGVVILEATIAPDGTIQDARVLRSIPLLDAAAVDAVRQWRFTPTLLNGVPVPVIMTVTVNFSLGGSELPAHACAEEKALLPKDDAPIIPTTITFVNHATQRRLVRLTPLGRSPALLVLQVEDKYEQTTIPGEPWMITDMKDACLAIYVAAPVRSTATIR
ncbi:MAG TPA: energy transducer TonB [Vicinamibacterales bacterium]|jgi:TonB family protein|nr:energy transducer TonB [Vicinamibacterales bacterium]